MEINSIPFNKPYLTGNELNYLAKAVQSGHISGNGNFTKKCHRFFEKKYNVKKCLLTTSCTDALEMCAMLINIQQGDEIIIPTYTFVSSALAFTRQGAKIVFADSEKNNPNIDLLQIEKCITNKTKAILLVHYAGVACNMEIIKEIADKYNLLIIEDAAQAIESSYNNKSLGTIGDLGCFSFHETKNIQCGEGGLLLINNKKYLERAEILWEKGTNRAKFFRGEINKYGWVDTGSSFLISDLLAAFLFAQLEQINNIQQKRISIWNSYHHKLKSLEAKGCIKLAFIPDYATNNAHMFYIICKNIEERSLLIQYLKEKNILSVFHYQCLHKSKYMSAISKPETLLNAGHFEDCLLRLPMYYELTEKEITYITNNIISFFE
jgi:dTDP-4-amino-4,6-dideoxygalactose transaminase